MLSARIEDSGRGFEVDKIAGNRRGGINGMRGRVLIANGRFSLSSVPGKGTVVTAELPLPVRSRKVLAD